MPGWGKRQDYRARNDKSFTFSVPQLSAGELGLSLLSSKTRGQVSGYFSHKSAEKTSVIRMFQCSKNGYKRQVRRKISVLIKLLQPSSLQELKTIQIKDEIWIEAIIAVIARGDHWNPSQIKIIQNLAFIKIQRSGKLRRTPIYTSMQQPITDFARET